MTSLVHLNCPSPEAYKALLLAAKKIDANHDMITRGNGYEEYHDPDCRFCALQKAIAEAEKVRP